MTSRINSKLRKNLWQVSTFQRQLKRRIRIEEIRAVCRWNDARRVSTFQWIVDGEKIVTVVVAKVELVFPDLGAEPFVDGEDVALGGEEVPLAQTVDRVVRVEE